MHRQTSAGHRDVKLCFVRLAKRANRHTDNDLVDSFRLAGLTGDSYSLVEMQGGPSANNLAFIEYDLALINTVRSSLLKNFCPRRLTFFVNRIRSPIDSAICFRSNTLNFGGSSGGSCFSTPSFPRMTASS
jgi:hypothetical protein